MFERPALLVQALDRVYDRLGGKPLGQRLLAVPWKDLIIHVLVQVADANAVEDSLCFGKALSRKRTVSAEGSRVVGRLTGSFDASISVMI